MTNASAARGNLAEARATDIERGKQRQWSPCTRPLGDCLLDSIYVCMLGRWLFPPETMWWTRGRKKKKRKEPKVWCITRRGGFALGYVLSFSRENFRAFRAVWRILFFFFVLARWARVMRFRESAVCVSEVLFFAFASLMDEWYSRGKRLRVARQISSVFWGCYSLNH